MMMKKALCFSLCCILSIVLLSCQDDDNQKEAKQKLTICTWGDSLMTGAGGGGTTYPPVLQSLLGDEFLVVNCGVGGENSLTIAARQGGIPTLLYDHVHFNAKGYELIGKLVYQQFQFLNIVR